MLITTAITWGVYDVPRWSLFPLSKWGSERDFSPLTSQREERGAWTEWVLAVLISIWHASPSPWDEDLMRLNDYFFAPGPPAELHSSVIMSSLPFYGHTKLHSSHREHVLYTQSDTQALCIHSLRRMYPPRLPVCVILLVRLKEDNELPGWPSLVRVR